METQKPQTQSAEGPQLTPPTPLTALSLLKPELPTIEALIRLNSVTGTDVAAIAMQELDFLSMHMIAKPFIAECIPETIIQAVKYSLKNNLSLDPNAGLVYLMPTSVKVGAGYKNALEIKPTADGKLSIAYQCRTILDHERAVITKNETGKVISCSIRILLPSVPNPRWEKIEMDYADFERLRKYSHIKNARGKQDANLATLNYANPLYSNFNGGIDPEFARSKVVSAALKKRGTNLAAKLSEKIVISSEQGKEVVTDVVTDHDFSEYIEVKDAIQNEATTTTSFTATKMPNAEDL